MASFDYFEITKIDEEVTNEKDETDTVIRILHIYLDERDLRDSVWHDLQPNGFTEPRLFNDFPQREHKVLMRSPSPSWLDGDGHNVVLETLPLVAERYNLLLCRVCGFLKKNGWMPSQVTAQCVWGVSSGLTGSTSGVPTRSI